MTDTDSTTTGPLVPEDITADSPFTLPGFFDALAAGQLVAARCTECDTHMLPPRPACYGCGSRAVTLSEQPRTGEVISYTSVNRPPSAFEDPSSTAPHIAVTDTGKPRAYELPPRRHVGKPVSSGECFIG